MTGSNPKNPGGGSSGGRGVRPASAMIGRVLGSDFELRGDVGRGGRGPVLYARPPPPGPCRNGRLLAPTTGELIAEELLADRPNERLAPFRPDRFA